MTRRLLVLLLALLALAAPGAAWADDAPPIEGLQPDANSAIAYNTEDGSSLFEFAFAVRHVMSDVVDQQNVAVAWSKCNSCQTTAIAIEIVLVAGNPSTVAPQNVAVAVNESCNLCDTFATAYQFVVGTDGPVRLTGDGRRELQQIRREIASWGKQKLSNEEIRARLPGMIERIKHVLATELRPVRRNDERDADEQEKAREHDAQPNAPPVSTATTETGTAQTTTTVPTDTTETTTTPTTTETAPTTTTEPTTTTTP